MVGRRGLRGDGFRGIAEARESGIWVASHGLGLFRQTGDWFERYGAGQWAGESKIRALYVDAV